MSDDENEGVDIWESIGEQSDEGASVLEGELEFENSSDDGEENEDLDEHDEWLNETGDDNIESEAACGAIGDNPFPIFVVSSCSWDMMSNTFTNLSLTSVKE